MFTPAHPPRARGIAVTVIVAAAVALAGCGGDDDAGLPAFAPGTPSPGDAGGATPSAAGTGTGTGTEAVDAAGGVRLGLARERPDDAAARQVYDAYVAFWRADLAALADPSKGNGEVAGLAVDPQRRRTLADIQQMRAAGRRSTGTMTIAPVPGSVEERTAQLTDCLDDTALDTVDAGGAKVPGTAGKRVQLVVTLKRVDDAWVVSNIAGSGGTC